MLPGRQAAMRPGMDWEAPRQVWSCSSKPRPAPVNPTCSLVLRALDTMLRVPVHTLV